MLHMVRDYTNTAHSSLQVDCYIFLGSAMDIAVVTNLHFYRKRIQVKAYEQQKPYIT